MRVIPPGLAAKYAAETQRLSFFLWLRRVDGFTVRLTSADVDVAMPTGTTSGGLNVAGPYLCDPGVSMSSIAWTAGLSVDNLEVVFTEDDTYLNRVDVLAKKWAKASFRLFRADPLDPGAGIDTLMVGNMGDISITRTGYRAELRSIVQFLQQVVGEVTSKTCKAELFDDRCKVDRALHTFTGSLTSASQITVADSSLPQPDDWFGDGELVFTSGACNGERLKVRSYTYPGQFTFTRPTVAVPEVGDSFIAYTGCRKRGYEDCRDKFDNILNNQSELHLPGPDYLIAPGDVSNEA